MTVQSKTYHQSMNNNEVVLWCTASARQPGDPLDLVDLCGVGWSNPAGTIRSAVPEISPTERDWRAPKRETSNEH